MKLGIIIDKTGAYLLEMPEDNSIITMQYVKENTIGWLFNVPNIYDVISLLPIQKYFVSLIQNDQPTLIEITKDKAQEFYSTLVIDNEGQHIKRK